MTNILALQAMDVSFQDDGPLSQATCPIHGTGTSIGCSTSSNGCDVVGLGDNYF